MDEKLESQIEGILNSKAYDSKVVGIASLVGSFYLALIKQGIPSNDATLLTSTFLTDFIHLSIKHAD